MTPDQQFARMIKLSMFGFTITFAYFMLADLKIPLTPQAMATHLVTKVAPQVSGKVVQVAVRNNQQVHQGELLFVIDPQPYELALQQAQLALEQAQQDNAELDASIAAAKASVTASEAALAQAQREAKRLASLFDDHSVSRQSLEQAQTTVRTEMAALASANAQLAKLKVSRGQDGAHNLKLRQAQNQLATAQLNLAYTRVTAAEDGVVTNLQLQQGSVVNVATPVLALVSQHTDIIADFREKTLKDIGPGSEAWVAFDGEPGRLYAATVSSIDAGVSAGQFAADGSLATPTESDRWVRDAQRLRLHLDLRSHEQLRLAAGARATVQLLPQHGMLRFLAHLQIKFISLLHYIY
ncbi:MULTISPECIES: HlyD family secretion protein [unclassified Shewanella]|uniref:HlyD family secretion protein n=1 Tax=unclassified Shewanella TaxID=196818 RepID=UPI001A99EBD5|nr:HlyD family secretion protein [Shewanella sp. 4t3-1-2LB]MBO1272548.1 HlyD family secretion protein [Shewanella sp. 4t3-1-2LB]